MERGVWELLKVMLMSIIVMHKDTRQILTERNML